MSLVLQSTGGGSVTINEPTTASNFTVTLPAADGVTMVSGNMPAFSAYSNNSQTIVTATYVKMQINTEEFDTASCYDPITNYRFTPNVAGYYQVNGQISYTESVTAPQLAIYKNGNQFKLGTNPASGNWSVVSALVFLNGSTDYIELFGAHVTGTTQTLSNILQSNYFQAALVRAA
jgi:hypothetical protein